MEELQEILNRVKSIEEKQNIILQFILNSLDDAIDEEEENKEIESFDDI